MLTPAQTAPTLRVGIYRSSSIGDVVLATVCIDLLRYLQVPVQIFWIGRNPTLTLIGESFPEVQLVEVKKTDSMGELQGVVEKLARLHVLVDLQGNLRSRWICHRLRRNHEVQVFTADKAPVYRNRLIFEARLRGRKRPLPKASLVPPKKQFDMMVATLLKALTAQLPPEMRDGLAESRPRPRIDIKQNLATPWQKELHFGPWLAIAPGAAHPTKQAPLELLEGSIRNLQDLLRLNDCDSLLSSLGLLFVGDESDRQVARDLLGRMHWAGPVLNLCGKLSLYETATALKFAKVLLSNDSALAHIAEAVDTPTAVLFGPTVEGFGFAPRMPASQAFSAMLGCRPCSKHGSSPCRYGDRLCFASISTNQVAVHLATRILGAKPGLLTPELATSDSTQPEAFL